MDAFLEHPAIGDVIVVIDSQTSPDNRWRATKFHRGAWLLPSDEHGKGQVCKHALEHLDDSSYVVFCDSDLWGLTADHISLLTVDAVADIPSLTIGVPDYPANYPTDRLWAWPWVSGERCMPVKLVRPLTLHGYLMEAQINAAAKHANLTLHMEWLAGLQSPFIMSEQRIADMELDAMWGREHGILP